MLTDKWTQWCRGKQSLKNLREASRVNSLLSHFQIEEGGRGERGMLGLSFFLHYRRDLLSCLVFKGILHKLSFSKWPIHLSLQLNIGMNYPFFNVFTFISARKLSIFCFFINFKLFLALILLLWQFILKIIAVEGTSCSLQVQLKLMKWILKQHCLICLRCEKHDLKK